MNAELSAFDAGDLGLFEATVVKSVDPPESDCSAVIGFAVLHRPQMHAGIGYDGAGGSGGGRVENDRVKPTRPPWPQQ